MRREEFRRHRRRAVSAVLDFVLPADCFACGRPLPTSQHLGACPSCWCGFHILREPCCLGCALPHPAGTDLLGPARGRCAPCLVDPPDADAARAAVLYDERARRFLLRAKLGGRGELLEPLGHQLAARLRDWAPARDSTLVVPVPSHPVAALRRGFSPAREIARPVARVLGVPLRRGVLVRRLAAGASVKRLRRSQRSVSLARAFRVPRPIRGIAVLLVDDVMTTGATLRACSIALRRAGATSVVAAAWARTPAGENDANNAPFALL